MTRPRKEPVRLRDLPGYREAFEAALKAQYRAPAGHLIPFVGRQALTTAGNFTAPSSIDRVTLRLLLCMATGIHHHRHQVQAQRRKREQEEGTNVIPFEEVRRRAFAKQYYAQHGRRDIADPSTWEGHPPWWTQSVLAAVTQDSDDGA